jgi:DNA-binding LacI/PurR family transcriptional regulator
MTSKLVRQVEEQLIDQVRKLSPLSPLPSEPDLAIQLGISRWTIRKALDRLEQRGIVRRIKRKGTFPAQGEKAIPLFRQRARMIGIIATYAFGSQSHTRPIASGAFAEASKNGYILLIARKEVREFIYQVIDCPQVDGLLLTSGIREQRLISELAKRKKPICLLDQASRIEHVDSVQIDSKGLAMLAVHHLYNLGHRKIAFIHSEDPELGPTRLRAYEIAMRKLKILHRPEWILEKEPTIEGGEEGATELLSLPISKRPTAIVVAGPRAAHGAMKIILRSGLQIPKDISVIAGGSHFPSTHDMPKLTRITTRVADLGRIAVQHLLDRMKNPDQPTRNTLLPVHVQINETTGRI